MLLTCLTQFRALSRRKSKRIHNRFSYGLVYSILGSLSAGYEEEVTDIVNELRENASNNK